LYKLFKLAFTLWLIHPDFLGALYLYTVFNDAYYERLKDTFLYKLHSLISRGVNLSQNLLSKLANQPPHKQQNTPGKNEPSANEVVSSAWLTKKLMQRFKAPQQENSLLQSQFSI
jgi:hypothetical protein